MLGQKNNYPWYSCVIPLVAENNTHIAEKINLIPEFISKQ